MYVLLWFLQRLSPAIMHCGGQCTVTHPHQPGGGSTGRSRQG
jgi:hypothetical protein